jgi:hypothetical protein
MIARLLAALLLAALCAAPAFAQTYTFTPQSSKDLTLTFQIEREGGSRVLILPLGDRDLRVRDPLRGPVVVPGPAR